MEDILPGSSLNLFQLQGPTGTEPYTVYLWLQLSNRRAEFSEPLIIIHHLPV
jgi:hypothetical protein